MTTYGATSDDKVIKLTIFCYQWAWLNKQFDDMWNETPNARVTSLWWKTSRFHITDPLLGNSPKGSVVWNYDVFFVVVMNKLLSKQSGCCPACRTTLVATRFRVAVICPIIQVPHCIRVFCYFVWFVFINHIFQFHYELCTYCNILDIYLS